MFYVINVSVNKDPATGGYKKYTFPVRIINVIIVYVLSDFVAGSIARTLADNVGFLSLKS